MVLWFSWVRRHSVLCLACFLLFLAVSKSAVVLRCTGFFFFLDNFLQSCVRTADTVNLFRQFKQGKSYWWLTHNPHSCQKPERKRMQNWRGIDNKELVNVGNECSCQAKRIETRGMSLLAIFVNRQNSTTFSRPADARNQNTEGVVFFFLLRNHPLDETMQTAVQNVLIWSGGVIRCSVPT